MKIKKLGSHATTIINRMMANIPYSGQVYISAPLETLHLKLENGNITDPNGTGKLYSLTIQPSHGISLTNKEIMFLYIKDHPHKKGLPLVFPVKRFDNFRNQHDESLEIRKDHVVCINTPVLAEHCQLVDCWFRVYDKNTPIYKE